MDTQTQQPPPGVFRTIKSDFRRSDNWQRFRREMRELQDFYLNEDEKKRVKSFRRWKRAFFVTGWLVRSMFFRLTPVRRILVVIGVLLLFSLQTVEAERHQVRITVDTSLLGGAFLVAVIMLELKDKMLARDELEAGRKVQTSLMPEPSPAVDGWELWLHSEPANEVGGDLVDFIRLDAGRFRCIIADVAGKGLKAALLTTKLQATVRAISTGTAGIREVVERANAIFHRDSPAGGFASFLLLEGSPDDTMLRFVNAGHLPLLVAGDSGVRELRKGEMALGLTDTAAYTEQQVEMSAGDTIIAYSDGITEAANERGEFFGAERLEAVCGSLRGAGPERFGRAIIAAVNAFAGNAQRMDDLSILVLRRTR